jgi:hypothetical protein
MDARYNLNGAYKPTLKRTADLNGPDFYPTPAWATHALIQNEYFSGTIWEAACGDGAMSRVLTKTGCKVYSSDLYDRGYGDGGVDFLKTKKRFDNIVTNPPFHSAQEFAERAVRMANDKVALLLRLAFLEGGHRARTIFSKTPPTRVWVFSERITFYKAGAERKGSGTTAYAWFVWDKSEEDAATQLKWIEPGFRRRYAD